MCILDMHMCMWIVYMHVSMYVYVCVCGVCECVYVWCMNSETGHLECVLCREAQAL